VPSARVPRIATTRQAAETQVDETIFELLRAWRRDRASADAVPAYVVLHDRTLRDLAATKPRSQTDLAAVNGFGPTKLERYGEDVLAVISAAPG
jgi:superfamily II DNA helicase RecQ